MTDIYNRLATDQKYEPAIETNDEIEIILQQVKMVLGTNMGDVLGSPYFGLNLKKYIFSMSYNRAELNALVRQAILSNIDYDQTKYTIDVSVEFGKDHEGGSDYAVVNVTINQIKYLGIMMTQ